MYKAKNKGCAAPKEVVLCFRGVCYHIDVESNRFRGAFGKCSSLGGRLAAPESAAEWDEIIDLLPDDKDEYWTGTQMKLLDIVLLRQICGKSVA